MLTHQRYQRDTIEKACRIACETIGMNYCPRADGWDEELVALAEQCMFDRDDIAQTPRRVARGVTAYLDEIARNP